MARRIFASIRINGYSWQSYFVDGKFQKGLEFLKHLSCKPALAGMVKTLHINPGRCESLQEPTIWSTIQELSTRLFQKQDDTTHRRKATKELKDALLDAIPQMLGLQSFMYELLSPFLCLQVLTDIDLQQRAFSLTTKPNSVRRGCTRKGRAWGAKRVYTEREVVGCDLYTPRTGEEGT